MLLFLTVATAFIAAALLLSLRALRVAENPDTAYRSALYAAISAVALIILVILLACVP